MITAEKKNGKTAAENVKNSQSRNGKKQALRSDPTLKRTTFRTSREMDFFSEKELTTQTGHSIDEWPLVFIKETFDNALDACEEAGVAPEIEIEADAGGISVRDNGPGIPEQTLAGAMDFTVRASNREMYVAPDRGAQGNALMTLLSMPFVVDSDSGKLIVETRGVRHNIVCRADPITQRAVIDDKTESIKEVPGTVIRIQWSEQFDEDGDVFWPFDSLYPQEASAWGGVVSRICSWG
jgi:DNA topoisomerase VI subunit B